MGKMLGKVVEDKKRKVAGTFQSCERKYKDSKYTTTTIFIFFNWMKKMLAFLKATFGEISVCIYLAKNF